MHVCRPSFPKTAPSVWVAGAQPDQETVPPLFRMYGLAVCVGSRDQKQEAFGDSGLEMNTFFGSLCAGLVINTVTFCSENHLRLVDACHLTCRSRATTFDTTQMSSYRPSVAAVGQFEVRSLSNDPISFHHDGSDLGIHSAPHGISFLAAIARKDLVKTFSLDQPFTRLLVCFISEGWPQRAVVNGHR